MPKKDTSPKKIELSDLQTPEQRIQFLYTEVFHMSELLQKVFEQQADIGQLLINLLKEYKNIQDFDSKFLK